MRGQSWHQRRGTDERLEKDPCGRTAKRTDGQRKRSGSHGSSPARAAAAIVVLVVCCCCCCCVCCVVVLCCIVRVLYNGGYCNYCTDAHSTVQYLAEVYLIIIRFKEKYSIYRVVWP